MKKTMTGDEYMRQLHERRVKLITDAEAQGRTMADVVADMQREGKAVWKSLKAQMPRTKQKAKRL